MISSHSQPSLSFQQPFNLSDKHVDIHFLHMVLPSSSNCPCINIYSTSWPHELLEPSLQAGPRVMSIPHDDVLLPFVRSLQIEVDFASLTSFFVVSARDIALEKGL